MLHGETAKNKVDKKAMVLLLVKRKTRKNRSKMSIIPKIADPTLTEKIPYPNNRVVSAVK